MSYNTFNILQNCIVDSMRCITFNEIFTNFPHYFYDSPVKGGDIVGKNKYQIIRVARSTVSNVHKSQVSEWSCKKVYYIPNCERPITSHHSYHVTVQYPTVLYGCYWTVVIAQLSAVDLQCKVNDKSRWPRKASEWGAGSFRLIVCKQNTSVNILFIINNITTYALRKVLSKLKRISDPEP